MTDEQQVRPTRTRRRPVRDVSPEAVDDLEGDPGVTRGRPRALALASYPRWFRPLVPEETPAPRLAELLRLACCLRETMEQERAAAGGSVEERLDHMGDALGALIREGRDMAQVLAGLVELLQQVLAAGAPGQRPRADADVIHPQPTPEQEQPRLSRADLDAAVQRVTQSMTASAPDARRAQLIRQQVAKAAADLERRVRGGQRPPDFLDRWLASAALSMPIDATDAPELRGTPDVPDGEEMDEVPEDPEEALLAAVERRAAEA